MTDDPDLLAVLAAADAARAKVVAVGDHRQLGAVGPGGGLEALIARHAAAVHTLGENIRQRDPAQRAALEHLRAGNTDSAADWYLQHGRVHVAATRDQALDEAVDGWFADQHAGTTNTLLLAWQRASVAALNQRARARWAQAGRLYGPEIAIAGRRYAAGDRILTLAPHHPAGIVTSQRGTVAAVDDHGLTARMDNGQTVRFTGDALGPDRLDYGYAATINRTQGATATTGRVMWDGGGREIAYVALSRTTGPTHIHVVADDVDQAAEDLRRDWASERRQQWVIDTDSPAPPGTCRHPYLHRTEPVLRAARLRAERAALRAALPPDPTGTLRQAQQQAATIRHELHDLHAGTGPHAQTPIGEAARRLRTAEHNQQQARQQTAGPGLSRRQRRSAERLGQAWAEELAAARHHWNTVAGPIERHLLDALDDAEAASSRVGAQRTLEALDRASGYGIHARIAAIDRELESIEAGLPNAPVADRPIEISRGLGLSL